MTTTKANIVALIEMQGKALFLGENSYDIWDLV